MMRRHDVLARLAREERGVGIITALIVSTVVLSLGTVVLQLAEHNVTASALDRKRIQSVHAAEAGINAYLAAVLRTPTTELRCTVTGTLPIRPGAEYRVDVRFYSTFPGTAAQDLLPCDTTGTLPEVRRPAGAVVVSTGTAVAEGTATAVSRTMETHVRMNPVFGIFNQAVYSERSFEIQNRVVMHGNQANDADVYTAGDFVMTNNTEIFGSVLAAGSQPGTVGRIDITRGTVRQDAWGRGPIRLSSLELYGNAISSEPLTGEPGIRLENSTVHGDAKSASDISLGPNSSIRGRQTVFAPSAPPPARALPQITWDAEAESRYVEDGYRITAFDSCASARTFIRGAAAAERLVVRLTDTSHCVWSNQTLGGASQNVVPIHGDMAVVTDGTMEWADNVTFQGVGGTHRLIIIRPFVAGRPCPSDAKWPNLTPASEFDFKFGNNTVFRSLNLFVYSPCFISFGNNNGSGVNGQIVGGRVTMTNQMTFNYRPMLVPNAHVVGYTTDMAFLREIATRRAPAA